jgi:hypothetical protein
MTLYENHGTPESSRHDEDVDDMRLVAELVKRIDRNIERHNSDRKLDRRLDRITQQPSRRRGRTLLLLVARWRLAGWRFGEQKRRIALRRLDRALRGAADMPLALTSPPSIEQLAVDLRRLDQQRRSGPATESQVWLAAVVRAYDDRLALASRCLAVHEKLAALEGLDRDIERIRVEAELESAGLRLSPCTVEVVRPGDRE